MKQHRKLLLALMLLVGAPAANAAIQTPVDQADPSVVATELKDEPEAAPKVRARPSIESGEAARVDVSGAITIGAIRVEGATALPAAAFADVIDRYIGRELSPRDLSALATDIANAARRRGYVFARAFIPAQRISNGLLRVTIDEGRIDEVRVTGNAAVHVKRVLDALANGKPVLERQLERRLLLAEDLAGTRLSRARLERAKGRNLLIVDSRRDPIGIRLAMDNWGSDTIGRVRAQLIIDLNGPILGNDQLTLGALVTPLQPRELSLAQLEYAVPIGRNGTQLKLKGQITSTHAGGVLRDRDLDGRSIFAGIGVSHPMIRSRSASLWLESEYSVLDLHQTERDARFRDDRIVTLSGSVHGNATTAGGRLRARLRFVRGLDLFDATSEGDSFKSRSDASALFSRMDAWVAYDRRLGRNVSLAVQGLAQFASRPLLVSEEMGLGGRSFLRGYDYREFSGDQGIAGSVEVRFDIKALARPINAAQTYVYADGGKVDNRRGGPGSGSLASAGGGIRVRFADRFDASLEVGVPLRKGADPNASYAPRVSLTLGAQF